MKNILLPTDFSENSKNAIRFALKFFEGETCTFYILNTHKPSRYITSSVLSAAPGTSVYEGILSVNKPELEKLIDFCKSISVNENFTFISKIDFANIVDSVNQAVSVNNIDLIVMGTTGATGAVEVIFGSNTLNIIRNTDAPVLAIPQNYFYEDIQSVLLSINHQYKLVADSLKILLEIVKKEKAALKILEIDDSKTETAEQVEEFREFFKEIKVERFSIKNLPAPMAINAFEQLIPIQLHVMFVERKKFLDRFIFGSDSTKISYSSRVPLLVLRP